MNKPEKNKSKLTENSKSDQNSNMKTQVKRRLSLQLAVKSFKSKIGRRSSSSQR